ncbi:MAG: UTP--glucose-1-phosphate uridylyltransferase GalU [Eubacteriales bacterium]|uniref:UTP--glucose-1-phosphate uridylyltransferase GalU n=1 Tax=Fenollaria sp. TaxID=1965292 RepID=UPI002A74CA7D|nr:UTP--glucose-1-phosphate uridylyltransferase GalU [Fenollaria sp.]MDD7340221.1 UTP--glucose-1-phosphate uridylyltransferase GalU [Eubacteriales bacterium]MDY3105826.1 UTP--glucose-1-phosphate uridylyltransferase GalU [Fenollaria sp.]
MIRKAIIPAAGLGTRMLPQTKASPKEMIPIFDKPTLQYIVEEAYESGITDILIITGRNKNSIEDHFDRNIELEKSLEESGKFEILKEINKISDMVNIYYIRQKAPLGLGHAILCAESFAGGEDVAVLLGDDIVYSKEPCLKQLMNAYDETGKSILGVGLVAKEDTSKYGIIAYDEKVNERLYKVKSIVEKPDIDKAPSNIAVLGRYILKNDIFGLLKNTKPGKNGEIQLTDAIDMLLKEDDIYAYVFEGHRYDLGSKLGFIQANLDFALRSDIREDVLKYIKDIVKDEA